MVSLHLFGLSTMAMRDMGHLVGCFEPYKDKVGISHICCRRSSTISLPARHAILRHVLFAPLVNPSLVKSVGKNKKLHWLRRFRGRVSRCE